MNEFSED